MSGWVIDSAERGRAARAQASRASHAVFDPSPDRRDPVEILQAQAATRVPWLVPIRHGRMLVSPFAFFRGGAAIMAQDLAAQPRTGLNVQCCGDAHLSNFGVFASLERKLIFDLNDFDETLPGPFEWDLKRLAASILIAAQDNGHSVREQESAVLAMAAAYREAMRQFADMDNLAVWYAHLDIEDAVAAYAAQFPAKALKATRRTLAKARTRDSISALAKLTEDVEGLPRIVDQSPLVTPVDRLAVGVQRGELFAWLEGIMQAYRDSLPEERRVLLDQFGLVDVAHKVVGVGSVGTQAWIALLLGHRGREPLFLQIKEAQRSVLEAVLGPSDFENQGQRVVVGQRLMQASSDAFLGWVRVRNVDGADRDYYGRQLRDWKGSLDVDQMEPGAMAAYGRLCGWTLARAHARSGDRIAITSYIGRSDRFDRAMVAFASSYAEQNERDYQALRDAVAAGTVEALEGL
jgi:uncharacterized protein (DUF2252 family)